MRTGGDGRWKARRVMSLVAGKVHIVLCTSAFLSQRLHSASSSSPCTQDRASQRRPAAVLGPQLGWPSQDSNPDLRGPIQLPFFCPRTTRGWWGEGYLLYAHSERPDWVSVAG